MKEGYSFKKLIFAAVPVLMVMIFASCKKDSKNKEVTTTTPTPTPTKLGLYEASDSVIYKFLIMPISQVGTVSVDYDMIFDTGSGGLVLDAKDILPSSMITDNGFNFTTDSLVYNGITVTKDTSHIEYGADANDVDKVYGNLAYAAVTLGDKNGNVVIKRLPFFLYYKAVDHLGKKQDPHSFDVLGVNQEYDVLFKNGGYVTSPFAYFDPGTGLTRGFKLAALGTSNFSSNGTYVRNVLTLGLTQSDLSSSSGFSMSQLTFYADAGYPPFVPGTIKYGSRSPFSTDILYDTGTEPYSYLQDPTIKTRGLTLLPANTPVTVSTPTSGFTYTYTTSSTENLTYVEGTTYSGTQISILGLEFFLNNEYMLDFDHHQVGVKNN
jgi:hypothetical protein